MTDKKIITNTQYKCPRCGSTDIDNNENGELICNFCHFIFPHDIISLGRKDIENLTGVHISKGADTIKENFDNIITIKCQSCGAEVMIDTNTNEQQRCHWCRSYLSINDQLPNGTIPDAVLPFKVSKQEANLEIQNFVSERTKFAHPVFLKEFEDANIMPVYLPYLLVDTNSHINLKGEGEILTRQYTVGSGKNKSTRYDANCYLLERDFDMTIDDMTIEGNLDKINVDNENKTTNIINAILPFDTKQAVKFNANYLKGKTSEKRDIDVDIVQDLAKTRILDVARYNMSNNSFYDRGIKWESESIEIKGEDWHSIYLPVWLYSYYQKKEDKEILHYVAVNGRNKRTMGSIPINFPKLIRKSIFFSVLGLFIYILFFFPFLFIDTEDNLINFWFWISISGGPLYFFYIREKYRNKNSRYEYEKYSYKKILNLKSKDDFKEERKGLNSSSIDGRNDYMIKGKKIRIRKRLQEEIE